MHHTLHQGGGHTDAGTASTHHDDTLIGERQPFALGLDRSQHTSQRGRASACETQTYAELKCTRTHKGNSDRPHTLNVVIEAQVRHTIAVQNGGCLVGAEILCSLEEHSRTNDHSRYAVRFALPCAARFVPN